MSITYPLTAPERPYARGVIVQPFFAVSGTQSPFTGAEKHFKWPWERWVIDVTLPPMTRAEAEEWVALGLELRGRFGTFLYGVQEGYEPRGAVDGTPLVAGGDQTGYTLEIDGLTPGVQNQFRKGDYFQIGTGAGTSLHKITRDLNSDMYGECVLEFAPAIRAAPANNAPLIFDEPKGIWRMDSNSVSWSVDLGMEYGFNFRAVEAVE